MFQSVNALPKGSVLIEFFELRKLNGTVLDLIPFVTEFNIYESVFEPFITATASLDDSRGIVDFDTINGSTVAIKYASDVNLDFVTMTFIVDSVNVILPDSSNKSQTYFLNLISPESLRAFAIRVGEIYTNLAPENMIGDILKNKIKSNKKFFFSKTNSIDTMNCSSLYPFQAIDAIKKRAVSRSYLSSSYMFYENQFGYHFKTLEEILSEASTDSRIAEGDLVFYYDVAEPKDIKNSSWRKIEILQKIKQQSLTENIVYGGTKSKIFAYNISTGEHFQFEYNEEQDFEKFKSFSPKRKLYTRVSPRDIYKQGDKLNNLMVAAVTEEKELLRIQKEILSRAYVNKLFSNVLRMEISGDSRLSAGSAAMLNIPVINAGTSTETNELASGIYLFAKIRHMFRPSEAGTGIGYRQYCEMMNTGANS
jgi:hypothetical protein